MIQVESDVVAIVVTHNGARWIQDCLQSLAESYYPVTAIVVDNGSTDNTLGIVRSFPDVICLPQVRNLGFGGANNIGIGTALREGASFAFLLNQDAMVHPETIGNLVQCSLKHPDFGILSPLQLNGEGTAVDTRFAEYLRGADATFFSDLYFGRLQGAYLIDFMNAAAWLLTRPCLNQVGGFDPLFFMYGEDNDFCNRAAYHGFGIALVPSAVISHDRVQDRRIGQLQSLSLERRAVRLYSGMLRTLKHPSGRFVGRLAKVGLGLLQMGRSLILNGDYLGLGALLLAITRILRSLPKAWKHRRTCQNPGQHWID